MPSGRRSRRAARAGATGPGQDGSVGSASACRLTMTIRWTTVIVLAAASAHSDDREQDRQVEDVGQASHREDRRPAGRSVRRCRPWRSYRDSRPSLGRTTSPTPSPAPTAPRSASSSSSPPPKNQIARPPKIAASPSRSRVESRKAPHFDETPMRPGHVAVDQVGEHEDGDDDDADAAAHRAGRSPARRRRRPGCRRASRCPARRPSRISRWAIGLKTLVQNLRKRSSIERRADFLGRRARRRASLMLPAAAAALGSPTAWSRSRRWVVCRRFGVKGGGQRPTADIDNDVEGEVRMSGKPSAAGGHGVGRPPADLACCHSQRGSGRPGRLRKDHPRRGAARVRPGRSTGSGGSRTAPPSPTTTSPRSGSSDRSG